jgi:phosphoglycolate phosphatase-like HAD superfamily hydrolase
MIKAVIFDFDGVIVESLDIKTSAFGELFASRGDGLSERVVEYHLRNSGVSRYDKIKHVYSEMIGETLDEETFEKECRRFSSIVKDQVVKAPFVAGAESFLRDNSGSYRFFVCSATPIEELRDIIRLKGLDNVFEEVNGSPRPKHRIVSDILCSTGLSPAEAVYIGDAMSDLEAAERNNVLFIGRNTSDKPGLFKGCSCRTIDDLRELEKALKKIGGDERV